MQRLLYFPLRRASDDIRLVRLRCGQSQDPIQSEMMQAPLHHLRERPGYEALSYTWGDPLDTRIVMLKDQPFQVTKNLEAALRNLRCQSTVQQAMTEFSGLTQFASIKMIFKNVMFRFVEWLIFTSRQFEWSSGSVKEIKTADKAISFINKYSESLVTQETLAKPSEGFFRSMQFKDEWLALAQGILIRPWWSRVWIVQEVAVANELIVACGSHTVTWNVLTLFEFFAHQYHASEVAQALRSTDMNFVRNAQQGNIITYIRHKWRSGKPLMLHQLVLDLRLFNASDAKDKLYAYLGLCVDAGAEYLNPDYSKATWQVYAQFAKHIILQQRKLDFICAGNNLKLTDGLPSWVPDFQKYNDEIPVPLKGLDTLMEEHLYNVSAKKPMEVIFSDDLRALRATGLLVGTIAALAPYWDPHRSTSDFFEKLPSAFAKWRDFFLLEGKSSESKYGSDRTQLAFSKTLTADRLLDFKSDVSRFTPEEGALEVWAKGIPQEFEPHSDPVRRERLWSEHVRFWFEGPLMYRCLAFLDNGCIGLLPQIARVEDVVCILFGCDTPVVLRPQGEGYAFVGEW